MIVCFDLDDTITAAPDFYRQIMGALKDAGCQVVVLSGHAAASPTPEIVAQKCALLASLGFGPEQVDQLVVVAKPDGNVADLKVAYMKQAGATALVDNNKANVKAARKAGFIALRHYGAQVEG